MMTLIIILLALTSAFKILTIAFLQKQLTSDRVQAINLAREGVEAVRYIRDYNWLYYGSNQRVCWNHFEDNDNNGKLDGADDICTEAEDEDIPPNKLGFAKHQVGSVFGSETGMEYILKQKENTSHWFLTSKTEDGTLLSVGDWDLGTIKDNLLTSNYNRSTSSDNLSRSFQLCEGQAGTAKEALLVSCLDENADNTKPTKFFRGVFVQYESNPQDQSYPNANTLSDGQEVNSFTVIVNVKWIENGIVQDVELVTKLLDFYKRNDGDKTN